MQVSTPLDADVWEAALLAHPDRAYASYVVQGLRGGFRVGFQSGAPLKSARNNMPSTRLRPEVITEHIAKEVGKGRMIGPLPPSLKPVLHFNRIGLIPKGHSAGKFRLITDISFPHGASVNDGTWYHCPTLPWMMWLR